MFGCCPNAFPVARILNVNPRIKSAYCNGCLLLVRYFSRALSVQADRSVHDRFMVAPSLVNVSHCVEPFNVVIKTGVRVAIEKGAQG